MITNIIISKNRLLLNLNKLFTVFSNKSFLDKVALIYLIYSSYNNFKNIRYLNKKKLNNILFYYLKILNL